MLKDFIEYKFSEQLVIDYYEELNFSPEIILYEADDNNVIANVLVKDEILWTTQREMARLFDVGIPAISKHLNNIFDEEELDKLATISKMEIVQNEGNREVSRVLDFYNLDAMIAK